MHTYQISIPIELKSLDPNKDMFKKRLEAEPIVGV